jgi:hypothetical protein
MPAPADHRRRRLRRAGAPPNADAQAAGTALSPIRSCLPPGIPEALIQRRLMVWTGLFAVISFELNGQRPQVAGEEPSDRDALFAGCVRRRISFIRIN